MIPIINVQGNIIGFGGRIMTERSNTGKYLNSPETAVFFIKENLFGLNFAKNDRSGKSLAYGKTIWTLFHFIKRE